MFQYIRDLFRPTLTGALATFAKAKTDLEAVVAHEEDRIAKSRAVINAHNEIIKIRDNVRADAVRISKNITKLIEG